MGIVPRPRAPRGIPRGAQMPMPPPGNEGKKAGMEAERTAGAPTRDDLPTFRHAGRRR